MKYILPIVLTLLLCACSGEQQAQTVEQSSKVKQATESGLQVATFAGGCFWCVEEVFEELKGVKEAVSGYAGGKEKNPTYEQVSYGRTSHAEAVQVYYDPKVITYDELLEVFFVAHDPTTPDRQGPDVGKQYRSVAFYSTDEEKKKILDRIEKVNKSGRYNNKVVSQVVPYTGFYAAEDYHQDYYKHHPDDPYIVQVSKPKVEKFRKEFKHKLK